MHILLAGAQKDLQLGAAVNLLGSVMLTEVVRVFCSLGAQWEFSPSASCWWGWPGGFLYLAAPYRVHWVNKRGLCKPAVTTSKCGNGPWEHTWFGVMNVKEGIDLFGHCVQISSWSGEGGFFLSHSFILKSHSGNFSCYILNFLLIYERIFNLFFFYLKLLFLNSLKHTKHTSSPDILEESPTVNLQWGVLSFPADTLFPFYCSENAWFK